MKYRNEPQKFRNTKVVTMDQFFLSEKKRSAINASHNISEQTLQAKIEYLKKWIDQCPHLPLESKGKSVGY